MHWPILGGPGLSDTSCLQNHPSPGLDTEQLVCTGWVYIIQMKPGQDSAILTPQDHSLVFWVRELGASLPAQRVLVDRGTLPEDQDSLLLLT